MLWWEKCLLKPQESVKTHKTQCLQSICHSSRRLSSVFEEIPSREAHEEESPATCNHPIKGRLDISYWLFSRSFIYSIFWWHGTFKSSEWPVTQFVLMWRCFLESKDIIDTTYFLTLRLLLSLSLSLSLALLHSGVHGFTCLACSC